MKNAKSLFVLILSTIALFQHAHAQEKFDINGQISNLPKDHEYVVYLYYNDNSNGVKFVKKTIPIQADGSFHYEGEVAKPTFGAYLGILAADDNFNASLNRKENRLTQIPVVLEEGNINFEVDFNNQAYSNISGTPENIATNAYKIIRADYYKEEENIVRLRDQGGNEADFAEKFAALGKSMNSKIGAAVQKYPNSPTSLDQLVRWVNPQNVQQDAGQYFSYLDSTLRASKKGQQYAASIKKAMSLEIGYEAPSFTLPDSTGTSHKLTDFRGKYVLVDFWASWCIPCRKEHPTLIQVYKDYKNRNFEILSISLDGNKAGQSVDQARHSWTKAIQEDKLSWTQLSDLKGMGSEVAEQYQISAIPMNFLIDPSGKIIAKNLRGDQLVKVLNQQNL